jgi:DNA-binding MarR family transcriptional regulator/GNAT superfamily N-acetyltransferase
MATTDLIANYGYLFLGSRLKRLAEQMQEDAGQFAERAGVTVPPGKFPLLTILAERGALSVGELANALGPSQPATTRSIAKLAGLNLVRVDRSDADRRSRIVSLTEDGAALLDRARRTVWPPVEAAVRQVASGLSGPLLRQIAEIERALAERSLSERAALIVANGLVPASDRDMASIAALMNLAYRGNSSGWNTEAGYITGDRTTEALLRADVAARPAASLMTWRDQQAGALQGCVWLEPLGDDTWYLGSLAVDPRRQNSGLGRILLAAAEQWINVHGGRRVRMTVVNVRHGLIDWYLRRGYRQTGETEPFPYDDNRFGTPLRGDLSFVILEKDLPEPAHCDQSEGPSS